MIRSSSLWLFIAFISITGLLTVVQEASAGFTLDLEVREAYEDNVIGLVADNPNVISTTLGATAGEVAGGGVGGGGGAGTGTDKHGGGGGGGGKALHMKSHGGDGLNDVIPPGTIPPGTIPPGTISGGTGTAAAGAGAVTQTAGDFSTDISVDAGYSHDVGERTTLLLMAGVEHIAYSKYTQFNFTIAELSAGAAINLTDDLIGKALIRDAVKRFNNGNRSANAYGGTLSLREKFTPSFWLKGVYDFEQNNADLSFDSYVGNSYSIWAGYALTAKSSVGVGFSYLTRDFKSSSFRLTSKTASADWTWEFYQRWSVNVGFDQQRGDSNIPDSATIDNIYSVALMFSY